MWILDKFSISYRFPLAHIIRYAAPREPDESMVEVAIAAVEAVFDWKAYLYEAFGYEVDDSWLVDEPNGAEEDED